MQIINWQPLLTTHQFYTWQAFQQQTQYSMLYVLGQLNCNSRQQQGWIQIDLTQVSYIILKNNGWWSQAMQIIHQFPDALHIFNGFWADKRWAWLIIYANIKQCQLIILNEAYLTQPIDYFQTTTIVKKWLKCLVKPFLYRLIIHLIHQFNDRQNICFLTLSDQADTQFIKAGFLAQQIFEFGYFIPKMAVEKSDLSCSTIKFIYVGVLNYRKGIDLAIKAVEYLFQQGYSIRLDIYGFKDKTFIYQSDIIRYYGVVSATEIQAIIAQYHGLILPSRHEGWGVVINEALLQAVPIIISDAVGAKCLLAQYNAGLIFRANDLDHLIQMLILFITDSKCREDLTNQAQQLSHLITPERAGNYIQQVINYYFCNHGQKPKLIWHR
jgi:glycosyltransferase involved in cell wall biosynthesis